jgi:hypothetical protein
MDANKTDRTIMTKYAVIPEGTDMSGVFDLTVGKRYKISKILNLNGLLSNGIRFFIIDDVGVELYSSENKSLDLNGQDWEIQEWHD